jgi:hypothetical protein
MVLTVPAQLREAFYKVRYNGDLLSAFMKCGHECLEDVVSTALRRKLKIGTIVVVQTHGRSGRYNPHLHGRKRLKIRKRFFPHLHDIMTSGGLDEDIGHRFELRYFRYEIIHKKWQYHLLTMVKSWFDTSGIKKLVDRLWKEYPNGLVANVSKGSVPERARGLARYKIRPHP